MSPPKSSTGQSSAPYGDWQSPITATMVAQQRSSVHDIICTKGSLLWLKCMSEENGRLSLHTLPKGAINASELTPNPYNVRSKVHEYGGAACLYTGTDLYFSNFSDQRLYHLAIGDVANTLTPCAITPEGPFRYADAVWDAARQRIVCVMEDHSVASAKPINTLVAICPKHGHIQTLSSGADFYASPAISPCGSKLSWLSWMHPHMPWDSTYLWLAEFDETGHPANSTHIAGNNDESIVQPRWGSQNTLYFISDKGNWWNIYRFEDGVITPLCPTQAEFAKPMWALGQHTYDITEQGDIIATYTNENGYYIGHISKQSFGKASALKPLLGPYPDIKKLYIYKDKIFFLAGQKLGEDLILIHNLNTESTLRIAGSPPSPLYAGYISQSESLSFETKDGSIINGYYYPPTNARYSNHSPDAPPLIIKTHGGPSSSANSSLDLSIQFWSSRGFAVFDVNYRGSTGFGRANRMKLYGAWGIADVEDCSYAANFLVNAGLAHPEKLIIRGHSAGGYTTLAALTFSDTFHAGASYYGISDLKALAEECHKFESCYVQQLLNETTLSATIYQDRSPLSHLNSLRTPVIFFQGAQDKVVPPNQAQKMVSALRENNTTVEYFEFKEEAHGFRNNANIETALNAELLFYKKNLSL